MLEYAQQMRNAATDNKPVVSAEFFDSHPVFTRAEFEAARASTASRSPRTTDSLLRRYVADGRLARVRGGLYAVVPRGMTPLQRLSTRTLSPPSSHPMPPWPTTQRCNSGGKRIPCGSGSISSPKRARGPFVSGGWSSWR